MLTMKKLYRLVFSVLAVLTLAFGLAGCGSNKHDSSKSSTSKDKVTKVVKHKNGSSDKQSSKSSSSKAKKNSNSSNSSSTNSNDDEDSNSSSSSSNSAIAGNKQSSTSSASSQKATSQKQLGLSDVAVWTDENGVTHHVDSDGMDRQTSPNQSGTTYKDWSGSLPSNAQIVKQN